MTDFLQISEQASPLDYTFANLQAADIPAYSLVVVDAANALSVNNVVDYIAVKQSNTAGAAVIGITMETLRGTTFTGGPAGLGRVRLIGPVGKAIASAAITAGAVVMNDNTGNGSVVTQTAGKAQIGIALSSAINANDEVAIVLCGANNA